MQFERKQYTKQYTIYKIEPRVIRIIARIYADIRVIELG